MTVTSRSRITYYTHDLKTHSPTCIHQKCGPLQETLLFRWKLHRQRECCICLKNTKETGGLESVIEQQRFKSSCSKEIFLFLNELRDPIPVKISLILNLVIQSHDPMVRCEHSSTVQHLFTEPYGQRDKPQPDLNIYLY